MSEDMTGRVTPCCRDCLSGDVAVKVTDELGFDHWFCAEDWAVQQDLSERIGKLLGDAAARLEELAPDYRPG